LIEIPAEKAGGYGRELPCGGRGRWFEFSQTRYF